MKKFKRIISLLGMIILLKLSVKKIPQESRRDLQKPVVSKTVGRSEHIGIDPKAKHKQLEDFNLDLGKRSDNINLYQTPICAERLDDRNELDPVLPKRTETKCRF